MFDIKHGCFGSCQQQTISAHNIGLIDVISVKMIPGILRDVSWYVKGCGVLFSLDRVDFGNVSTSLTSPGGKVYTCCKP